MAVGTTPASWSWAAPVHGPGRTCRLPGSVFGSAGSSLLSLVASFFLKNPSLPPTPLRAGGLTGAIMERVNGSGHRPAANTQGPWPACRAETVGAPALGRVATANFSLRRRPGRGALRLDGSTCVPWPVLPERPFRGRVRVSLREVGRSGTLTPPRHTPA